MRVSACTIVVPVHNQLEYTRRCLESVFRHADLPFRLVVVDNASRDGTAGFLAGLAGGPPPTPRLEAVEVITNRENAGVARSWNRGLRAAAPGRPVVFLNNDVVVTPGWLGAVLSFLAERPEAGIAGPHVTDGELPAGYEEWAAAHAAAHRDLTEDGFHGCCFALSPEVIARVGEFDERFEIGGWEDVDYCHRARLAGFSPRVTHRAVVHHFGSRTIPVVVAALGGRNPYLENMARFAEKWGMQFGRFTVCRSTLITW